MMVTFPNMGVAIIWKRLHSTSAVKALKDSTLLCVPSGCAALP